MHEKSNERSFKKMNIKSMKRKKKVFKRKRK